MSKTDVAKLIPVEESVSEASGIQVFTVGAPEGWGESFRQHLGASLRVLISLSEEDWSATDWQLKREPCQVWAILFMGDEGATGGQIEKALRWTQLLAVILHPTRLLVLSPALGLEQSISLVKAGATGILPRETPIEAIHQHLRSDSAQSNRLLPDPQEWLTVLTRIGDELLQSEDAEQVLQQLLRTCTSRLRAQRATLFVYPPGEGVLELVAAISSPGDLKLGDRIEPNPESITAWVLEQRKPLLLQGQLHGRRLKSESAHDILRSAVSAPLLHQGECVGVVNISREGGDEEFSPADLSMVEVFASMASFAIVNQRLTRRMLDAQRLATIGRTTADISHCVKNIVQALKGGLHVAKLGRDHNDPEGMDTGLRIASSASERMSRLVLDLLEFSKQREPELETIRIERLLKDVMEDVRELTTKKQIRLSIQNHSGVEAARLDAERLYRALLNLVGNSIGALGESGTVNVTCRRERAKLFFSVSDDGPGVREEDLPNIFEPFFSTKGSKGTGLGLAMVRKFAEENQGRVTAMNNPEGGLRVEIQLPCLEVTSRVDG